jgi:hypothetical protein
MQLITCYVLKYISLQWVCYRVWVTRRVKNPRGTGMGKNSNPHAGMGFLVGRS